MIKSTSKHSFFQREKLFPFTNFVIWSPTGNNQVSKWSLSFWSNALRSSSVTLIQKINRVKDLSQLTMRLVEANLSQWSNRKKTAGNFQRRAKTPKPTSLTTPGNTWNNIKWKQWRRKNNWRKLSKKRKTNISTRCYSRWMRWMNLARKTSLPSLTGPSKMHRDWFVSEFSTWKFSRRN